MDCDNNYNIRGLTKRLRKKISLFSSYLCYPGARVKDVYHQASITLVFEVSALTGCVDQLSCKYRYPISGSQHWDYRPVSLCLDLYTDSRDLKRCPHTYTASTSPNE